MREDCAVVIFCMKIIYHFNWAQNTQPLEILKGTLRLQVIVFSRVSLVYRSENMVVGYLVLN